MPDIGAHKQCFKRILRKARNENVKSSYVTVDGKQEPARNAGMENSTRKRNLYAEIRYLVTVAYVRSFVSIRLSNRSVETTDGFANRQILRIKLNKL